MLIKEYVLEKIKEYCTLDETLCRETFEDLVVSPLENAKCFEDWTWDSGVTKGVLIFDELDYVIKIPFYCEWDEGDYDYDEETNETIIIRESGPFDTPFEGVQVKGFIHDNDWDYCETEQYRYIVAERNGLNEHFAKTWFLGTVQDWPIYAQAKANMFLSSASQSTRSKRKYSKQEMDTAKSIKDTLGSEIDEEWMIDFINYWGKDRLVELLNFCNEWDIDDLHLGNIGYVYGVPCIIDYSSYRD